MNTEEFEYSDPPTREQIEKGFNRLCEYAEQAKDLNSKNKVKLIVAWELMEKGICEKCGKNVDIENLIKHRESECIWEEDKWERCKICRVTVKKGSKMKRHTDRCGTSN